MGSVPSSGTGGSPPHSVHGSRRAPSPDVRINHQPPVVLDGYALCLRYLVLAGLIALPFDFSAGYLWARTAGRSHQTLADWLKSEGVQIAVKVVVAALLIWLPYRLIAKSPRRWWLLHPRTHSIRVSRAGGFARVGETADDFLQASRRWPA